MNGPSFITSKATSVFMTPGEGQVKASAYLRTQVRIAYYNKL
jgi:hypothetical protein